MRCLTNWKPRDLLEGQVLPGDNRPDRREFGLSPLGKTRLEEWADLPVESQRFMRQEFMAKLHHVYRLGSRDQNNKAD